LTYQRY